MSWEAGSPNVAIRPAPRVQGACRFRGNKVPISEHLEPRRCHEVVVADAGFIHVIGNDVLEVARADVGIES